MRFSRSSGTIAPCLVTLRRFENSRNVEITVNLLHVAGSKTSILRNNRPEIGSALGKTGRVEVATSRMSAQEILVETGGCHERSGGVWEAGSAAPGANRS